MMFSAPRNDLDIRQDFKMRGELLDTTPPSKNANKAWDMRPRNKENEIGPEFRFDNRT